MEARDRLGRTALMHAVERDERQVVAVLVLAGADRDAVSADGMTALRLARGWGRPNMQFMLGEHSATGDEVPIVRTVVQVVPTGVRLTGDPRMLHLLAEAVEIALDDLGDDEWRVRTGWDAGPARTVAARLRAAVTSIDVTSDEFGAVRSALAELAFGTTRTTPAGTTRLDVDDLLDRLD